VFSPLSYYIINYIIRCILLQETTMVKVFNEKLAEVFVALVSSFK
jgi:hypothetical protein